MKRQIILDTETTGLEWQNGDRLIEIGCVEMVGRKRTGRQLHRFVNPEREVPEGAVAIHGITTEFLADKPKFRDVAAEFVDFVRDAELVIHNAAFDVGFIDNELNMLGLSPLRDITLGPPIDTVRMARDMFPGKRANLDALCERFGIDNTHREFHGAARCRTAGGSLSGDDAWSGKPDHRSRAGCRSGAQCRAHARFRCIAPRAGE